MSVAKAIRESIEGASEGTLLSAKEYLHLGSRAAADQTLSRLARQGHLLRVGRGRYVKPVETRFGIRTPSPERVVKSFVDMTGEVVVPSGAVAANELGLTTQVPMRPVFLTSGRSRRLHLGRHVIELRQTSGWQLRLPDRAGQAVRALFWLGPSHAYEAANRLKRRLTLAEQQTVLAARASLPTWLAKTVSETFAREVGDTGRAARA
jgi:hypothetical protein